MTAIFFRYSPSKAFGAAFALGTALSALPCAAQTRDSDPYSSYSTQQTTAQQRLLAEQAAREASNAQVAAPTTTDRYRPDEIETRDDRRVTDRDDRRDDEQDTRQSATRRVDGVLTRRRRPSEFETFVSQIVDKPLRRFGTELLIPEARDFTVAPTTTVPTGYRINPGDELVVGLTGSIQVSNLRLTVDSEGRIFIPRIGAVTVGGVRYGDVQGVIAQQVSRQYRDFRVAVSVGRLQGITVYVTGFAATPGSYTVSSLSTVVNAVLAAGGPSPGGSFRSIQVRRNGQLVADFDLYDLLLKGDKTGDIVLLNGDVLYVAPVGAQVGVIGSVNNEAIFEAKASETLTDMLLYAGGVNTVADDSRLLVLNPLSPGTSVLAAGQVGGWEELTPAQVASRVARRGEIVRVLSAVGIARPLEQQSVLVTVSGEVARPGRYYVQPGTSVDDIMARAGGLSSRAYPYATVVTRESVQRQQRLSYERALRDLQFLLTAQPLVSARTDEQLQPARLAALQSLVDQLEARKPDGRVVLTVAPTATAVPGGLVLENNDTIFVPPVPTTVGVFGSVPNPASFQFAAGTRIRDYLDRAGGVQKIGDKSQMFVIRASGEVLSTRTKNVLKQPALPGDLVFVPVNANRGEFWARLRDITAVLFQGAVTGATVAAVAK